MSDVITAAELKSWVEQKRDFVMIDTATAEEYAAEHIPGAQNACVYEVTFLDQVKAFKGITPSLLARVTGAGPNTREPLVVYGSSARSLASSTAASKLEAAGYSHVHDLRGGLEEWRNDGNALTVDASKPGEASQIPDGTHPANPAESLIEWAGRSLASRHHGTIALKWGEVETRGGLVVGAQLILDMTTISVSDLTNPALRAQLVKHLSSDDFFDVQTYPEAKFVLSAVEPIDDAAALLPNHQVSGKLRLKGREETLEFPASIGPTEEGGLAARAHFDIDRTQWGVLYGSGKFYEKLGKHLVSDLISLDLKIVVRKQLS